MMSLPGIYFGQYHHVLMSDAAKRPLFLNSAIAFNTHKPESNTNTLPVDQTGISIIEASQWSSQDHQILSDQDLLVSLSLREDPMTR